MRRGRFDSRGTQFRKSPAKRSLPRSGCPGSWRGWKPLDAVVPPLSTRTRSTLQVVQRGLITKVGNTSQEISNCVSVSVVHLYGASHDVIYTADFRSNVVFKGAAFRKNRFHNTFNQNTNFINRTIWYV
uniref:Pectinesterase n=1 Tax=Steinernema glaseri TaxID=37863 RepID=A0A1I7ZT50_9BILA